MDIALASNAFTTSELRLINYCRLYVQAVTVSDITTAQGVALDPILVLGGSGPSCSSTTYCPTNQALPNSTSWKPWLRLCTLIEAILVQQPLGQWLHPADQLRRNWPAYFDHSTATLYVRSELRFVQYRSLDSVSFVDGSLCDWSPSATSVPVEATLSLDASPMYTVTLPISPAKSSTLPPPSPSFLAYLSHLPPSDRLLFESLELLVPLATLLATLDETVLSRTPSSE